MKPTYEELEQMISMQAEVLKTIAETRGAEALAKIANEALSATAETVAAWRAKETEPLRREVAALVGLLVEYQEAGVGNSTDFALKFSAARRTNDFLSNGVKDSALAYEREVKAKALEEFGEKYRCVYLVHRGTEVYVGPELKELADKEAAELRAHKE